MRYKMKKRLQAVCKKYNIPTNSRVFLQQFVMIVLLLAFVGCSIILLAFWSVDKMVEGTKSRLDASSASMVTAIDTQLNGVIRVVNELTFDYDITYLVKGQDWYSAENQMRINRINKDLRSYPLANSAFGSICVCFLEHDRVLTGNAVLTIDEWSQWYFSTDDRSAADYADLMKDPDSCKDGRFLMPHQSPTMGADAKQMFVYVKSFPINKHEPSRVLIYVQLDMGQLAFADGLMVSDGVLEVVIEDDNGQTRSLHSGSMEPGRHVYETRFDSYYKGITYTIRYGFGDVMHNAAVLRAVIWITFFIYIAGCVYVAYRLSLKNYKPIKRLLSLSLANDDGSSAANEFVLLEETLIGLNERIKEFEQTSNSVNKQIILRDLIRGAGDPKENLNKLFGPEVNRLYLMVIRVNDMGDLGDDGQLDCDSTLAEFAANNISTEILSREFKVHSIASNRVVYLLILAQTDVLDKLEAASREIYLTLQNYLEMEIAIGIRAVDDDTLFSTGVLMDQQLETASLLGQTGLIPAMQNTEELPANLSCENEGLLSKALAVGDTEAARLHLEALHKQVQQYASASPAYIRFHMTTLIYIMTSSVEMLILHYNLNRKRYNELIRELPNEQSVPALMELSKQLLNLLENDINQTTKYHQIDEEQQLVAWICQAVDQQHSDPDLSVSSLANQKGMSVSYISKKFKSNTGMGLLEYIHRVRIRHGKQLMADQPKLKVKEIAEKVGYINATSFIRAFKRYEGVTPGKGHAMQETEETE